MTGLGLSSSGGVGGAREVSDEELVQRIREGEAPAGETLCRRYHAPLFRYLQRISRSATVAEETIRSDWAADESATLARYSRKRRPGLVRVI